MPYNTQRRILLAQGLKFARRRAGLSARKAAELMQAKGVECTRGTLLAWERSSAGRTSREPFSSDLVVLADVFGCNVGDFFTLPASFQVDRIQENEVVCVEM